jgi:hypothetical protein
MFFLDRKLLRLIALGGGLGDTHARFNEAVQRTKGDMDLFGFMPYSPESMN